MLSAGELAKKMNVTTATISNWVRRGCPYELAMYGSREVRKFEIERNIPYCATPTPRSSRYTLRGKLISAIMPVLIKPITRTGIKEDE